VPAKEKAGGHGRRRRLAVLWARDLPCFRRVEGLVITEPKPVYFFTEKNETQRRPTSHAAAENGGRLGIEGGTQEGWNKNI